MKFVRFHKKLKIIFCKNCYNFICAKKIIYTKRAETNNFDFMNLSKQEISHIAKLARLELTDAELEKYGGQLSAVLNYIDQLKEVDVKGVEPMAQASCLENVLREDEIKNWDEQEIEEALAGAPEMEDGFIKVKRVIE